jgi:hypothetical protein
VSRTVDESAQPTAPPREELERHPCLVLKDEGPGSPRVLRYELPGGAVVLKEWAPSGSRIMDLWAGVIMRREIHNYRVLSGVPGIPRFLGAYGPRCFLIEWVDAEPLRRRLPQKMKERGLDELEEVLSGLHERRFVHLDLHQRLNALFGRERGVWLIDLGQGVDCSRGLLRRLLFPWLARVDRRAILKFRARYAPLTLPAADRERLIERHAKHGGRAWKNFHRRLRNRLLRERR